MAIVYYINDWKSINIARDWSMAPRPQPGLAMLGEDFSQQGDEAGALGLAEVFQQALFVLADLALQLAQQRGAGSRQADRVGAAVMQGDPAFDQAAPFQVVDHGDHRRAVELRGAGQFALLEVGVRLDDDQHAEQAGRHVLAAGALGEVAEQGNLGHAQLVADKLGQHAVIGGGFLSGGGGGGHGVAWSVRGGMRTR